MHPFAPTTRPTLLHPTIPTQPHVFSNPQQRYTVKKTHQFAVPAPPSSVQQNGLLQQQLQQQEKKNVIIEEKYSKKNGITGEIEVVSRKYLRGRVLGQGGFAKCYEVFILPSNTLYAAKIVDKRSLTKPKTRQKIQSEIKIHAALSHKNIVEFERVFEDDRNVYIILEICKCRTLMDLLKKKRRLSENETQYFMVQILDAVRYMHDNRVIHRDLKLGNLFLNENMVIKIGDYGLAAKLDFEGQRKTTLCGTPNYIAPEVLNSEGHSTEVDIWSIGVIMYTLLVGIPPFETPTVQKTYIKIKQCKYNFPSDIQISDKAKSLIKLILNNNPDLRPDVNEILQHPFFTDNPTPSRVCPPSLLEYAYHCTKAFAQSSSMVCSANDENVAPQVAIALENPVKKSNRNEDMKSPHIVTARPALQPLEDKNIPPANNQYYPKMPSTSSAPRQFHHTPYNNDSDDLYMRDKGPLLEQEFKEHVEEEDTEDGMEEHTNLEKMRNNIEQSLLLTKKQVSPSSSNSSNTMQPDVWLVAFNDYEKYGLAYLLNTNEVGAHFNDSTKLILNATTGGIEYYVKNSALNCDQKQICSLRNYPPELQKKVTLILYFKQAFEKEYPSLKLNQTQKRSNSSVVYVKRWLKTSHATIFRLSNKTVQVCFGDKSEMILSKEAKVVIYTNSTGVKQTISLPHVNKPLPEDISKRLKYAKDILYQLIAVE